MTLKLGSHVSMGAPEYFLGSVKEALDYKADSLMLYTGAPQNSRRTPVEKLMIPEGIQLWKSAGKNMDDVIIHLPYIINLANTLKPETVEMGKQVLKTEIERTEAFQARYMVLHPGSSLTGDVEESLQLVAESINEVRKTHPYGVICLETMAGKGSEVGRTFEQIRKIIDLIIDKDRIGVCLDTCHIHDGGYDLADPDAVLVQFDEIIGLNYLHVLHINDSKNPIGSHKDRHANIGTGEIGTGKLVSFINCARLSNIPMILETPYINGKAPYGGEIELLRKESEKYLSEKLKNFQKIS